ATQGYFFVAATKARSPPGLAVNGSMKRISKSSAFGGALANVSIRRAWIERGQGHSPTLASDCSSIPIIMTFGSGIRLPRILKRQSEVDHSTLCIQQPNL